MKNAKTKFILSAIIFLSVIGFAGTTNAAGASLYVSPATLTKTTGNTFGVSVGFNASGNKVCAVEGTLVFNNLSCQSIVVSGDVDIMPMPPLPTCSNPHFLIGIQNCTTSDKVFLTLSVKAGSAGTASISATGVDIIGEGSSISTAFVDGNYTITAPAPVVVQQQTPPVQQPTNITKEITLEEEEVVVAPEEVVPQQEEVAVTPDTATPEGNILFGAGLLGALKNILSFGTDETWLSNLTIFITLIIITFGVFYFVRKSREKK